MLYRVICLTTSVMLLVLLPSAPIVAASGHPSDGTLNVAQIVENMSPEERVGQLFVVTFEGATLTEESPVYGLIQRYGIGGVVLNERNDNFDDRESVVRSTRALITSLQKLAVGRMEDGEQNEQRSPLPLLVGIKHQGGVSQNAINTELTFSPSPMAIGAAWELSDAGIMGEISGFELNAMSCVSIITRL